MLNISPVKTKEDIDAVREILIEYAESLGFDLCFQNFEEELANLPGDYAPPEGCLLLAKYQDEVAGCVALRKLSDSVCEGKRLYVKPKFRGLKIGRKLVEAIIEEARKRNYSSIQGHTLVSMQIARALYASFGFKETKPHHHSLIEGIIYIELKLTEANN